MHKAGTWPLTVDAQLDAVLLGLRPPALAQEDALVVGGDVSQNQGGPSALQAQPLLVLAGLALALALAHAEDECRLLLVDLTGERPEVRVLGLPGGAELPAPTSPKHSRKTNLRG